MFFKGRKKISGSLPHQAIHQSSGYSFRDFFVRTTKESLTTLLEPLPVWFTTDIVKKRKEKSSTAVVECCEQFEVTEQVYLWLLAFVPEKQTFPAAKIKHLFAKLARSMNTQGWHNATLPSELSYTLWALILLYTKLVDDIVSEPTVLLMF